MQRLIAGSPHLLFEDKSPIITSSPKKLDDKSEKAATSDDIKNNVVGNIHLPSVNNITKEHNHLPNYVNHHLGNLALASNDIKNSNSKQSPNIVYPPPPANQWLVPVMSPSEGLVYKPIIGPCPPNSSLVAPLFGACSSLSLNPGNKDVLDQSLGTNCHQKVGIFSSSSLPQLLPTSFMHRSISASAIEQMEQSNYGTKNHQSNAEFMYQTPSSNMSTQISQVMSRNISNYQSYEDNKELQISRASSPSKRMKGVDELPLFPVAPTLWPSSDRDTRVENQSRVIKALPHNAKSASESAARIFKSIQEERKLL